MDTKVLSQSDLTHFAERGFVRVSEALPMTTVTKVQNYVWSEYEKRSGVVRDDPATWQQDWIGINKKAIDKVAGIEIGPRLVEAVNQILGEGQWRPLNTLGGLLFTLPQPETETWNPASSFHFDNSPHQHHAQVNELMLFTFYSAVGPRGGGTLVLSGSTFLIDQYLSERNAAKQEAITTAAEQMPFTEGLVIRYPWLAELIGKPERTGSITDLMKKVSDETDQMVEIVEMTGQPGDAVLCHPALLHAVSQNASTAPRIMRRTNFRRKR